MHFILIIGDAAAVHDMGHGAMADLTIRGMPPIAESIDHGALEVSAPPPGDEAVRRSIPTFIFQKWLDHRSEALLHVDNGSVLVEYQPLDFTLEDFRHVDRFSNAYAR